MDHSGRLNISAPAKINIGLDILHRRPDGFHDIDTIMLPISLADSLELQLAASEQFSCSDPDLPMDADNLVIRALRLFEQESGIKTSLQVHLEKRIPSGAGLGGGSSDAVAMLRGANQLYDEPLSFDSLLKITRRLGSDIPFFLYDSPCRATGRGELLEKVNFPAFSGVVIYPGFSVSTAIAYQSVDLSLTSASRFSSLKSFVKSGFTLTDWQTTISNDFELTIFQMHPELARLKQQLYDGGAGYASLSGSGSALFALYRSPHQRDEALQLLDADQSVFSIETSGSNPTDTAVQ